MDHISLKSTEVTWFNARKHSPHRLMVWYLETHGINVTLFCILVKKWRHGQISRIGPIPIWSMGAWYFDGNTILWSSRVLRNLYMKKYFRSSMIIFQCKNGGQIAPYWIFVVTPSIHIFFRILESEISNLFSNSKEKVKKARFQHSLHVRYVVAAKSWSRTDSSSSFVEFGTHNIVSFFVRIRGDFPMSREYGMSISWKRKSCDYVTDA